MTLSPTEHEEREVHQGEIPACKEQDLGRVPFCGPHILLLHRSSLRPVHEWKAM
jgi:hypothetical protein